MNDKTQHSDNEQYMNHANTGIGMKLMVIYDKNSAQ